MTRKGRLAIDVEKPFPLQSGDVYQLVYLSTSLIPPLDAGGRQDVLDILAASQRRNRICSITGALTYNEFHFAQVLEGPRRLVDAVFSSIKKDRRHASVTVVEEKWIEKRDFADWAMAYVGDLDSLEVISPNLQLSDIVKRHDGDAMALIHMMQFFLHSSSPRD
jgi:hypothetical protein